MGFLVHLFNIIFQLENDEYSKRGWKTDLPMWGKRGWNNLHSGWGKRDSISEEDDELVQAMDKRAWQRLQVRF